MQSKLKSWEEMRNQNRLTFHLKLPKMDYYTFFCPNQLSNFLQPTLHYPTAHLCAFMASHPLKALIWNTFAPNIVLYKSLFPYRTISLNVCFSPSQVFTWRGNNISADEQFNRSSFCCRAACGFPLRRLRHCPARRFPSRWRSSRSLRSHRFSCGEVQWERCEGRRRAEGKTDAGPPVCKVIWFRCLINVYLSAALSGPYFIAIY